MGGSARQLRITDVKLFWVMGPLNKRNTPIVKMRKGSKVERLDTKNTYR